MAPTPQTLGVLFDQSMEKFAKNTGLIYSPDGNTINSYSSDLKTRVNYGSSFAANRC